MGVEVPWKYQGATIHFTCVSKAFTYMCYNFLL